MLPQQRPQPADLLSQRGYFTLHGLHRHPLRLIQFLTRPERPGHQALAERLRVQLDQPGPGRVQVDAQVPQGVGGQTIVLPDQAEQDVFGADVGVAQLQRLAQRQFERFLGLRGEGDVPGRRFRPGGHGQAQLVAHPCFGDAQVGQHPAARSPAVVLAHQGQQDVLGADVVVVQGAGLFLRLDDRPARPVGEPLEHAATFPAERGSGWRSRRYAAQPRPGPPYPRPEPPAAPTEPREPREPREPNPDPAAASTASAPAIASAAQACWYPASVCRAPEPTTTTTTATPTALPTCRAMLSTALPVVARSGGSVPAAANSGAWVRPAETPATSMPGRISVTYDGWAVVSRAQLSAAMAIQAVPATAGQTRPNRWASRPALTANTAAVTGPGMMASPARTAL